MTKSKIFLSKIARSQRLKSFRASAALILTTTLMLLVAAVATVATAQTYTDLHNFDGRHGKYPQGILAQGRDGNLYGTTYEGGTFKFGAVFRITTIGKVDLLYNFDAVNGNPAGGLTLGTDGNFYGTTRDNNCYGCALWGTIFKITKTGSLTTLHSFDIDTDGGPSFAPPIQGTDGNFYGTTDQNARGYKITSSGSFTPLLPFPIVLTLDCSKEQMGISTARLSKAAALEWVRSLR